VDIVIYKAAHTCVDMAMIGAVHYRHVVDTATYKVAHTRVDMAIIGTAHRR